MNRIVLTALAECIDDPVKVKDLFKIQLRNNKNLLKKIAELHEHYREQMEHEPDDLPDGVALEVENWELKQMIKELQQTIDDVARRNNKLELEIKKLKDVGGDIRTILISPSKPNRRKQSSPVKKVVKVKKSPVKEQSPCSDLCMCRIWDNKSRRSDVQCTVTQSPGEDYCKKHLKNIEKNGSWWLGRIDEDRNEEQYGPPGTKAEQNRHLWHDQKNIKKSKSPVKKVVKKSPQPKKSPPVKKSLNDAMGITAIKKKEIEEHKAKMVKLKKDRDEKKNVWGECDECGSEYYENELQPCELKNGDFSSLCMNCYDEEEEDTVKEIIEETVKELTYTPLPNGFMFVQ